jgi:hypothetical protein
MKSTLAFLVSSAIAVLLSGCSSKTTGAVDGEWDVISIGEKIKPSSFTVASGKVSGALIDNSEGAAILDYTGTSSDMATPIDCTLSKSRIVVDLNISGNVLNGSFTDVREYTGSACAGSANSYRNRSEVFAINGTRTRVDASSDTDLNGSWDLQFSGGIKITASIKDLTGNGTVFGKDGREGTTATFSVVTMTLTGKGANVVFKKR